GDPEGSFLHRLAHQRAHPPELRGGRLHVALAEHVGADRARAHEGGDIGRNAVPLELVQVLPESGPVDRVVNVGLALPRMALHLRSQRPHRVLAEHLERHPWRRSLSARPSAMRDSSGCASMLMNPGATALPRASTRSDADPGASGPT